MQKLFEIQRGLVVFLVFLGIWMGESICTEASSAPELSVNYKGVINIMEKEASPQNINKEIPDTEGKITSSGNEIFLEEENAIDIRIRVKEFLLESAEENFFRPEDVKIELYQIEYDDLGGERKKKLIQEMQIEQIESEKKLEGKVSRNTETKIKEQLDESPEKEVEENIDESPEEADGEISGSQEKVNESDESLEKIEKVFGCTIKNLKEGHYKIEIRYENSPVESLDGFNSVGGLMTEDIETANCMENGYYESPLFTIDTKEPIITELSSNQNVVRTIGKRQYFQEKPKIIIRILEENFNRQNFSVDGKMFYANGNKMSKEWEYLIKQLHKLYWKSYYKNGVRINEASINIDTQANYTFKFQSSDTVGHKSNQINAEITYDNNPPEIIYTGMDNLEEDLIFKAVASIDGIDNNLLKFRKYSFFRYFCPQRIYAFIRARDKISGVEKVNCTFISYDKKIEKDQSDNNVKDDGNIFIKETKAREEKNIKNRDLSEMLLSISPEQKNFKGYLKVYAEDYGRNVGAEVESKGMISESVQLHKECSNMELKMPKPFFIDKEKRVSYYNKEVLVKASFEDNCSGLYKTSLYAGKNIGDVIMRDGEEIVYRKEQRITLKPEDFCQSSAESPIVIQGTLEDNVGHIDKKRMGNKVVIDVVKPIINVAYDSVDKTKSDNGINYYNVSRKATVTVTEKNFNPKAVKWNIQGSNQSYRSGEWKTVQGKYMCEVQFGEDGENYAINLSVTDYAGNTAEWKDKESFTIDKTVPKISIKLYEASKMDDSISKLEAIFKSENSFEEDILNLKKISEPGSVPELDSALSRFENKELGLQNKEKNARYFNRDQVIVFCIQDKNFDKDKVEYSITALNGKKRFDIGVPTKYIKKGQNYYGRLLLKQEARYHIAVKCIDKAGNESKTAEIQEFIIDKTVPQVKISGVENNGIYEGETIMPQILCKDKHLDIDAVKVRLCRADGSEISKEEWAYDKTNYPKDSMNIDNDTVKIQWKNLENKRSTDGIYQLFVEAADKAGNKLKDNFKINFRVNRWGADFIFEDSIKKEINRYYLKEAPQLILKEQCVKQTSSRTIILRDNEERKELEEENIKQHTISDKSSSRYGWYEKVYTVGKENFAEEGDYRVSFQADSKEEKLRFVVDRTPPVIKIGNLDDEVYEEEEHIFTVAIMDNYAFKKLELYIEESGGVGKVNKVKKKIIRPEDLDDNYTVREKLIKSGNKQTIRYVAWDKAGNKLDSEENGDTRQCYVTTNKALRGYYKHAIKTEDKNKINKMEKAGKRMLLVAGVVGIAILGSCIVIICVRKRESRKQRI